MNECTVSDQPLVSIVMAIYNPKLNWLREQLDSINRQTVKNIELNIIDDCSPAVSHEEICQLVKERIKDLPYTLERNQKNLGSNATFELLTEKARGRYIAYCDQDDIWMPEKLDMLLRAIQEPEVMLVCSDMLIIDENGNITAESITEKRRHHRFYSGEGLAPKLIFHNWVTGCTMLVRSEIAKAAIPFCPFMVHDHWLALFSAARGKIRCIPERLIKYRIHGGNQTLEMAGVHDRESYIAVRINLVIERLKWLEQHMECSESIQTVFHEGLTWVLAREANLKGRGGKRIIWKYRRFSMYVSLFEIAAAMMPEPLFMRFVELKRKNRI